MDPISAIANALGSGFDFISNWQERDFLQDYGRLNPHQDISDWRNYYAATSGKSNTMTWVVIGLVAVVLVIVVTAVVKRRA